MRTGAGVLPLQAPLAHARTAVPHVRIPSALVECTFYGAFIYSTIGDGLGISLPFPAAALLLGLAVYCVSGLHSRATAVYGPLAFALACGVSYLVIQLFVHGEPLSAEYVKPFVSWLLTLVIIQSLAVRRGFLHRFALVTFLMCLVALSAFDLWESGDRMSVFAAISIANSNDLGAWFGFCAVYFITTAFSARLGAVRVASGLLALVCLSVVGLTVSRAALVAVVAAALFVLHRVVRAGVFAILVVVAVCWAVYESGIFRQAAVSYAARATEDTGRFVVWPLIVQRIVKAPLAGVGADNLVTEVPGRAQPISPHNPFLFLALASGLLPAALFAAFWWRTVRSVVRSRAEPGGNAAYRAPLLAYVLLIIQSGNMPVPPWVFVATSLDVSLRRRRVAARPVRAALTAAPRPATALGDDADQFQAEPSFRDGVRHSRWRQPRVQGGLRSW